jgi:predicted component of type VI protein secretion system
MNLAYAALAAAVLNVLVGTLLHLHAENPLALDFFAKPFREWDDHKPVSKHHPTSDSASTLTAVPMIQSEPAPSAESPLVVVAEPHPAAMLQPCAISEHHPAHRMTLSEPYPAMPAPHPAAVSEPHLAMPAPRPFLDSVVTDAGPASFRDDDGPEDEALPFGIEVHPPPYQEKY